MIEKMLDNGIGLLASCFPDKVFNHKAYWHLLQDLPDDKFMKAIEDVCRSSKDIYLGTNIIAMIREKATVKPRLTAGEGWECVLRALRGCGERDIPKFKDPLVQKTVDCLGWKQIFNSEITAVERSNFTRVYNELAEKAEKEDVLSLPEGDKKRIGEANKLVSDVASQLQTGTSGDS